MNKLAVFVLTAAGILAISAALLNPRAEAQEATPTPLQCNGQNLPGGQTIAILDHATITPPEGYFYNWAILPPGGSLAGFTVCIVGTDAWVFIGVHDCTELRRINPSANSTLDARLDAIVESCNLKPPRPGLPNTCRGSALQGGILIELANGISLYPPGGGSFIIGTSPPSLNSVLFCHVEGAATVTISVADCSERNRSNPSEDESTDYYLDRVVASCVKLVQPTIPPEQRIPAEPPTETPRGRITPPDTGDAGLKP